MADLQWVFEALRPFPTPTAYASVSAPVWAPSLVPDPLPRAALCLRLGEARARPSNLRCEDAEAREVGEQLNRDAGHDPVYGGPIENASAQEAMIQVILAISGEMGPYVYRMAPPELL
jgi:hypothetical protein